MALRNLNISGTRYSVYFRWQEGVTTLLRSKDGEVAKDVQRRAYAVQKRMKRAAGYRYGTLRRGIHVESVRESPDGPYSKVVSTAQHTMVHEYGRKEIVPNSSRAQSVYLEGEYPPALRFFYRRGERKPTFRRKVRAVKGTHFMENSVDAALD